MLLVLLHGMYMNGESWAPWIPVAEARGYEVHTPSWPHHDGSPAERRNTVHPALGTLTFKDVTEHLKEYLDALPDQAVLIGHSIGGLLVQKLVNDGYGRAGVAISPAPPRGVLSGDPHFYRANLPHVNPFAGNRPVIMTRERFHYTFCNTMRRADSDAAYERYVVPESRNVPRSTAGGQGAIDFVKERSPLLMIAGDSDHLTPLAMVRRNARRYRKQVEVRVFEGRSHFICNQDGWEDVAGAALDWAGKVTAGSR